MKTPYFFFYCLHLIVWLQVSVLAIIIGQRCNYIHSALFIFSEIVRTFTSFTDTYANYHLPVFLFGRKYACYAVQPLQLEAN